MIDLPLLAPFLPEIGGAMVAVALIILAAIVADKLSASGGGGFLGILSAPVQAATSLVHSALNAVSSSVLSSQGGRLAHLIGGTAESLQTLIDYPARLFAGVHAALTYLWHTALPAYVTAKLAPITAAINDVTGRITTDVASLRNAIADAIHTTEDYADGILRQATAYTDSHVHAAIAEAASYADVAVAKVRTAEDAAVAHAVAIATTAENDATAAFDQAKAYAGQLVAPVGREVTQLDSYIKGLDVPAIAAGATATAALVTALLADTGLSNSECRNKVKGICGTDPNAWVGLLAGIAFMSGALSLREILPPARVIFAATKDLIEQAA